MGRSMSVTQSFHCFIVRYSFASGVGEAEWAFKTSFDVAQGELSYPNVDLVFGGLDTFAAVALVCLELGILSPTTDYHWQNGKVILKCVFVPPFNICYTTSRQIIEPVSRASCCGQRPIASWPE